MMQIVTLRKHCEHCGRTSLVTYEEPENDQTGQNTRWTDASGCWRIDDNAKLENCCPSRPAKWGSKPL